MCGKIARNVRSTTNTYAYENPHHPDPRRNLRLCGRTRHRPKRQRNQTGSRRIARCAKIHLPDAPGSDLRQTGKMPEMRHETRPGQGFSNAQKVAGSKARMRPLSNAIRYKPGGFTAYSRGLSEATPPELAMQTLHPDGVAERQATPRSLPPLRGETQGCAYRGYRCRSTPGYWLQTLRVYPGNYSYLV